MNDAARALVIERLKQGCSADAIHAEVPGVSVGEIVAIAETEQLTRSQAGSLPTADLDPKLVHTLAALAWGEDHPTARIRNLAQRTRAGLTDLLQLQRDSAEIEATEREINEAKEQLAAAQGKLRRLKNGASKAPSAGTTPGHKQRRNEIREWARVNGYEIGDRGAIPK
ncbi:histone-like nucleoid-structuring protein Lsr2 [Streptomyces sp. NPDC059909]|uniref:Lsr2 family DNA-binding protein n=1 Tax=Streptomyces sp. NPDC059909 TaxID=3346998 RepID=UPI00365BA2F5